MAILRKTLLAIIGALSLSRAQAEKIKKKLLAEGQEAEKQLQKKTEQIIKATVQKIGIVTKEDLKRLEERIKKMLKK